MTAPKTALQALGLGGYSLEALLHGVIPTEPATARRAEALLDLIRESAQISYSARRSIMSPRAAGEYLLPRCQGWTEERFGILVLNAKGYLLADRVLSQGTCTGTLISPREFFREALRYGATSALAYHNHPSGDPTPSREDTMLTRRLREAGYSVGIPLADHIIVGADSTHSFRASQGWDNE